MKITGINVFLNIQYDANHVTDRTIRSRVFNYTAENYTKAVETVADIERQIFDKNTPFVKFGNTHYTTKNIYSFTVRVEYTSDSDVVIPKQTESFVLD